MRTWTAHTWTPAEPHDVLAQLVDPRAIARWSPVGFEPLDGDDDALRAGTHVRVRGCIAGRAVEFAVDVLVCDERCLLLTARGPVTIEVEYLLCRRDRGCEVLAALTVLGRGMVGRLIAHAAEALLAAGVLDDALARISAAATAVTV